MFILKKLITCCLVPPGLFIVLCLVAAFFTRKRARTAFFLIAAVIYVTSVGPTVNLLLGPLERAYPVPSVEELRQCDAYVVLGGGVNTSAPTIDGKGMPAPDAFYRVMAAYRLYLMDRKPIIISGGDYMGREPEAEIVKRYLLRLGVDERYVIAESKSRDTRENALYTREICKERRFGRVALITSAFHMTRSVMLFRKISGPVTPFPTGHRVDYGSLSLLDMLPDAGAGNSVAVALKEYIGILFYKITL
jgi:uncharacterized SAM-binding protein YcdF (DUF218 family)